MHATRLDIREASFNLLPHENAVHKVVPRRRSREASNELDGFSLNSAVLGSGGRHGQNLA